MHDTTSARLCLYRQVEVAFELPTGRDVVKEVARLREENELIQLAQAPVRVRLGGAPTRRQKEQEQRHKSAMEMALNAGEEAAQRANDVVDDFFTTQEQQKNKQRKAITCSHCGQQGHKKSNKGKPTCPKLRETEEASAAPERMADDRATQATSAE